MNSWEALSQIRLRIREEEGDFRKADSLKVALCHPASYAVGMSSLGYQTICREIHHHPGVAVERAFLPDKPEEYRNGRLPVFTYENERPLSDFPIVAFSIAYELEITGILEILDLCGLPPLREDRSEKHPLIVAGGPLTMSNPRILYPFIDMIILGEGDEPIHEFLDAATSMTRGDLLSHFARRPGFDVPGRSMEVTVPHRAPDGRLPAFSQILTPNTVLSGMFLIEPERGCSRSCRYCVMRGAASGGMRLASADEVASHIPSNARRVGLVGAAVTDHPEIKPLLRRIIDSGREVGVSSLRADRLDDELVQLLARGGYRSLTTASDGASQRLRDWADRNITEKHLMRAAELAHSAGMQRLRLYMMIGFPGETDADIDELIRFSREIAAIGSLSLSIAPFVAKRNTPLDGAPFEAIASLDRKFRRIRSGLKGLVDVRSGSSRWAWIEHLLSQGEEEAGLTALEAWRAGGGFAAWRRAFGKRGRLDDAWVRV